MLQSPSVTHFPFHFFVPQGNLEKKIQRSIPTDFEKAIIALEVIIFYNTTHKQHGEHYMP